MNQSNPSHKAPRNVSRRQAKKEIWNLLALNSTPPNCDEIASQLRLPLDLVTDICDEIDELESIRAFDAAIVVDDEVIPFEQAVDEIEKKRR